MRKPLRIPPRALLFRVIVLLAGALTIPSCDTPPPGSDGTPHGASGGWRPGDRLLDRLDALRVVRFPSGNLPPELADLRSGAAGDVVIRSDPVPMEAWDYQSGQMVEAHWPGLRLPGPEYHLFWCEVPLDSSSGSPTPVIVKHGRRQDPWNPAAGFNGGEAFWYDGERQTLYAIAVEEPAGVALEYPRSPDAILRGLDPSATRPPAGAADLSRRVILDHVLRDVLLLPAPGAVSLDLPAFDLDGLDVAVGVVDRGWKIEEGVVVPATDVSDGVSFRVEVESLDAPGGLETVWSRYVLPSEGFVDDRVDLSAYRGRNVRLRLISDPGPAGNADFDYAVWGGLRFRGRPMHPPSQPHVVIVDIDTLRADRMSLYGNTRPTTPRIDHWASAHAAVFLDAISPSNWTRPSTASMVTGLTVNQHRVGGERPALVPALRPLALVLAEAGYETRAMVGGGHLMPDFGFDLGFEVYDYANEEHDWASLVAWMAERDSERPLFLFIQTYMVHAPYRADDRFLPGPGFGGRLAGRPVGHDFFSDYQQRTFVPTDEEKDYVSLLYDAGVRRMDEEVGEFLEAIEDLLADDGVLVILTADHGEALFEHDVVGHGQVLYGELLHVPLVVRFPEAKPRRSGDPVSGLDIVPTVLEAAGLEIPAYLPGIPLSRSAGGARVLVAETPARHYAIRSGNLKLIRRSGSVELYDLAEDPGEHNDLAPGSPDRARELDNLLADYLETYSRIDAEPGDDTLDADTLRSLRALGYVN